MNLWHTLKENKFNIKLDPVNVCPQITLTCTYVNQREGHMQFPISCKSKYNCPKRSDPIHNTHEQFKVKLFEC